MAIEVFTLLSSKIGEFLSFEDRRKCIEAHRCFEHINDSNEYHIWNINESQIICKKYLYLKKYKPRIKKLEINIKTILKMQDIIDIDRMNIKKIILNIKSVPKMNQVITEVFSDTCPENIHFSCIKQEDFNDIHFYKVLRYQLDKCKLLKKTQEVIIEFSNIKEFLKRFSISDITKINKIYFKGSTLYMDYKFIDMSILTNCKNIYCDIIGSRFDEFFYDIVTCVFDSSIINTNNDTLDLLEQYANCSRLDAIYFKYFSSQSIIIAKLLNTLKSIPAKTFIFWHSSLLDPSLYIVIKALLKENKKIILHMHEPDEQTNVCCGLLIYHKCTLNNLKIELSISKEYASYTTKKNSELLDLIEDEYLRELFMDQDF